MIHCSRTLPIILLAALPAGFYYGTADSGYFYSPDGVAYTWTGVANANLADNRVNCLFANTAGTTVYAGTKGGLSICAAGTCTGFTTASGLPQNDVTAVDVDCRGFVWVGTRDSGLAVYDTLQHTWSYIKAAQGLPSNRITAVNCSTSCDCYIGTLDGGAIIVDTTQTLKQLPTAAAEIRQAAASVRVFPQPAADVLHVTTENIYGAGQIYLYDISGKLVLGQSVALDKAFSVNVSDLDNGFYFYRISGQNKVLATGKIVLSR
jgi:ligand-binding sensor domain-containing protein